MIKYLVIGIIFITALFIGRNLYQRQNAVTTQNQPAVIQQPQEEKNESYGGYGFKKSFYNKGGVSLQHYWPGEGNFSNEETEILIFNASSSTLEVKSFYIVYLVENRVYPQKGGTWEKFPSRQSWDRIEYLNISPQYYKSERMVLAPGQKGKLHWHINFGPKPLNGKQTVNVKLTLLKGSETLTIDEEFSRNSGTVFSKDNR